MDSIPRRNKTYEWTEAEKACGAAVTCIENTMGAHPMLTKAQNLIKQAQDMVADYVDGDRYDPFQEGQWAVVSLFPASRKPAKIISGYVFDKREDAERSLYMDFAPEPGSKYSNYSVSQVCVKT